MYLDVCINVFRRICWAIYQTNKNSFRKPKFNPDIFKNCPHVGAVNTYFNVTNDNYLIIV